MLAAIRIALQAVLFFLLLGVVMAIADGDVGVVEKLVAAALGLLLIWIATRVRGLGRPPAAS